MNTLTTNENVFICGLTNVFAIAVVVCDNCNKVQYQYVGSENEPIIEAEIQYELEDEEGNCEPYFETVEGVRYYLKEFTRR